MTRHEREEINRAALATDHLLAGLGVRSTSGVAVTFAAQLITILVQIGYTAATARLLRPHDFGIAAMAMAVTGLAGLFTDMGLSTASVQRRTLDQNIVSALFAANLALGLIAMLGCFALAYPAALLFKTHEVILAVLAFGAIIPVSAAAVQHLALLQRGMRLFALQAIGVSAIVIGSLVGVLVAWFGGSYWALIAAAAATALVRLVLAWTICPWRPSFVTDWSQVRGVVSFGAYLTGFNITLFLGRQADTALIGAYWGASATGFYSRAYQLMLLPVNAVSGPLGSVFIPALSRVQNDPPRWRETFLRTCLVSATIGCLGGAILVVTGQQLIAIVYGPGWKESAVVFQWLSVSMLTTFPMGAMAWAFVSLGNSKGMFQWGVISLTVLLAVFGATLTSGLVAMAIGYSVTLMCLTPVIFYLALRRAPLSPWVALTEMLPLWLAAGVAIAAGLMMAAHLHVGTFADLIIDGAVTSLTFAAALTALVFRRPIWRRLPAEALDLIRRTAGAARG